MLVGSIATCHFYRQTKHRTQTPEQLAKWCGLNPGENESAGYERRMQSEVVHPIFGYRLSYRRILEVQARLLARVLSGEIKEYPAFVTR